MWLEFLLSDQIIGQGLQIYEIENVSALTGNVNGITGNVNALTGNAGGITGNVNALTGNVNGLTGNVNGITGNVNILTGNVNGLTGNAGIMQSFYFFRILKVTDYKTGVWWLQVNKRLVIKKVHICWIHAPNSKIKNGLQICDIGFSKIELNNWSECFKITQSWETFCSCKVCNF